MWNHFPWDKLWIEVLGCVSGRPFRFKFHPPHPPLFQKRTGGIWPHSVSEGGTLSGISPWLRGIQILENEPQHFRDAVSSKLHDPFQRLVQSFLKKSPTEDCREESHRFPEKSELLSCLSKKDFLTSTGAIYVRNTFTKLNGRLTITNSFAKQTGGAVHLGSPPVGVLRCCLSWLWSCGRSVHFSLCFKFHNMSCWMHLHAQSFLQISYISSLPWKTLVAIMPRIVTSWLPQEPFMWRTPSPSWMVDWRSPILLQSRLEARCTLDLLLWEFWDVAWAGFEAVVGRFILVCVSSFILCPVGCICLSRVSSNLLHLIASLKNLRCYHAKNCDFLTSTGAIYVENFSQSDGTLAIDNSSAGQSGGAVHLGAPPGGVLRCCLIWLWGCGRSIHFSLCFKFHNMSCLMHLLVQSFLNKSPTEDCR